MFGTVWDYEYTIELENGEVEIKRLHLVYNLRALKIYYNFFGSDMMSDFYKSAFTANNAMKALPEELRKKIATDGDIDIEALSEEEFIAITSGLLASNAEFTEKATVALIAAGESVKRSADDIMSELPITINDEVYRKQLIEFITFCAENAKKKQSRVSVGAADGIKDYTVSLIYGACQIGLYVSADDMSPNLLMAVADYAAKCRAKDDEVQGMNLAELRRKQ